MKNFAEKLIKKRNLNTIQISFKLIENCYIIKYGSYENAVIEFEKLKQNSKDENEFEELLFNKFKNDFHIEFIESYLMPIITAKNYTTKIKSIVDFEKIPKKKLINYNLKEIIYDIDNIIKPAFNKTFNLKESDKNELVNILNESFNFNLASVRNELSFPHPRTFNLWLKAFFGDKYNDKINKKGRSAGKLTLYEYVEIVSAFMLNFDEEKFDYSNILELNDRFENDKITQKKILKKLTNNNYALLKEKLEDIKSLSENNQININVDLPNETEYRNIPFRVVSIIKKQIEEYK